MCLLDPVGASAPTHRRALVGSWDVDLQEIIFSVFVVVVVVGFSSIFQGRMAFSHLPAQLFFMSRW